MNIQFNGKTIETQAQTLAMLLSEQGFTQDAHVATAVNGQFVPKASRDNQAIQENDQVEVVAPMQGG